MLKCRFLSSKDANYLHLVEKISPKVLISLVCKILANLYLSKQFYSTIPFFSADPQILKSSLNHFYIPAGSLIHKISDCVKVMFGIFERNFHFGNFVGPVEMSKWAHVLGAIKLTGPRRASHWLCEPKHISFWLPE